MNNSTDINEDEESKSSSHDREISEKLSSLRLRYNNSIHSKSPLMHQGPVPNKKYMEPQVQCQLLTIQNLYDPDDSVTIHPINLTASGWINNDYCGLKKKFIQRENSSLSLNKTGYNKKQSLTTINNLNASKTNRILNLAVFPKKTDSKSNLISKKLKSNQSQLNSKTRNNLDKEVKY